MNIRIHTAHGYLSFQPDGRIEYRPAAGPWENLDIEGLQLEPGPGPGPPPTPAPPGIPATPTVAYVAAVKAQLQAQGVDLSGGCGAFQITKRVAWGLRGQGYGLLAKPSGNHCDGYATDIVMQNNGSGDIVDILGDGGNGNTPNWNVSDTVDPSRWRPPVEP
jgi:hypothetical protein